MKPSRRELLLGAGIGLAGAALVLGWLRTVAGDDAMKRRYTLPAEGSPHAATWMAYGATADAWGTRGAFGASRVVAREDLLRIAFTLSRFETVHMLVANRQDLEEAKAGLARMAKSKDPKNLVNVSHDPKDIGRAGRMLASRPLPAPDSARIRFAIQPINDLWTRDIAPVFVRDAQGDVAALDLNYNGWGQEPVTTGLAGWTRDPAKARNGVQHQYVKDDRAAAAYITKQAGVPRAKTWLTMEGGGIEVNGHGLAVVAESCILNPNRNPGKTKADVEVEFRRVFGVEQVIWIPGIRATEITDGHVDFYARFLKDAEIAYTWDGGEDEEGQPSVDARNLAALKTGIRRIQALSAESRARLLGGGDRQLHLTAMASPDFDRVHDSVVKRSPVLAPDGYFQEDAFAAGYIGYYEANGCVLLGQFGDPGADAAAFRLLQARYPDRTIVQLTTDGIANGGGSIHCATQQQLK